MKIKLLFSLLIVTAITPAQNQVNSFYGTDRSSFNLLTAANPLDHSATGADKTWTFNQLTLLGNSVYTYEDPTPQETTTYPWTTKVIIANSTEGSTTSTTKTFTKNSSGTVSMTGLTGTDLNINFSSDIATLGTFPMAYGATNTDSNVSGTYTYSTYSGTFTGTLTTSVDAYGTLNLPDFNYTKTVTRLKTVLNISLNYGPLINAGTVTQTSYSYYDPTNALNNPELRSVNTTLNIPILSVNQENTTLEKFVAVLAVTNPELQTVWVKNPVENSIEINSTNSIDNADIMITDILGKTVYQGKHQTIQGTLEIPVSLNKGMYFLTIGNEKGNVTKKIIRN